MATLHLTFTHTYTYEHTHIYTYIYANIHTCKFPTGGLIKVFFLTSSHLFVIWTICHFLEMTKNDKKDGEMCANGGEMLPRSIETVYFTEIHNVAVVSCKLIHLLDPLNLDHRAT